MRREICHIVLYVTAKYRLQVYHKMDIFARDFIIKRVFKSRKPISVSGDRLLRLNYFD